MRRGEIGAGAGVVDGMDEKKMEAASWRGGPGPVGIIVGGPAKDPWGQQTMRWKKSGSESTWVRRLAGSSDLRCSTRSQA